MSDAEQFYQTYYVPSNIVTTIVGDVDTKTLIPMIETYFGRIPPGPEPPVLRTVEPEQIAEKVVTLRDPAQPFYIEGYHKGSRTHPDQPVYDAIDDILSNGRTGRLYKTLVRDEKIAVATGSFSSFPGDKYPTMQVFYAVPSRGVRNEQVRNALRTEIDLLIEEPVSDEELQRFKTRAKANLLRSLGSNQGLANNLTDYQTAYGDWRELFRYIDKLEAVTKEDIQRVAKKTFKDSNRTVGMIETETDEEASS
jgi:predicted Zn-dependent peptidase